MTQDNASIPLENNIFARLDSVEKRQFAFQIKAEENSDRVFNALESAEPPSQGILRICFLTCPLATG
jgi:hypothetical protein